MVWIFCTYGAGFEGALIPILIKAIGRDDKKSVTEAIGAGIRDFSIITIFKLIASFGLIYFIPSLVPVKAKPLAIELTIKTPYLWARQVYVRKKLES